MNKIQTAFIKLGDWIRLHDDTLESIVQRAFAANPWFTVDNVYQALDTLAAEFLEQRKLMSWLNGYRERKSLQVKKVALILAGNIPLVGFHDLLCVLLAGHDAVVKLSEKDNVLLPALIEKMLTWCPDLGDRIFFTDRLSDFDAAIATGSNQSSNYFKKYFARYPNIIRKNRNAVAVLSGTETDEDILNLGRDIFTYFGLGCRNVSKIYVPRTFDFAHFLNILNFYRALADHGKYRNNYDYNFATAIINNLSYMCNDCLILLEEKSISSRIAVVHYEYYDRLDELEQNLIACQDQIQCIVSRYVALNLSSISFGEAQKPTLSMYADGIDTMKFLLELK